MPNRFPWSSILTLWFLAVCLQLAARCLTVTPGPVLSGSTHPPSPGRPPSSSQKQTTEINSSDVALSLPAKSALLTNIRNTPPQDQSNSDPVFQEEKTFSEPPVQPLSPARSQLQARPVLAEDGLETIDCPTATQTVYLRPKTVTRTVHVIRSNSPVAAGGSLDYVTVNPNTVRASDMARTAAVGDGPPAQPLPTCIVRPSTEFRSFVYLSTQYVYSTVTEYATATATRTVSIPVDVYQEPVTHYKTVYVNQVQPSLQYRRPASGRNQPLYEQNLPVTFMSTVTVTQLQDCPSLSCDQPAYQQRTGKPVAVAKIRYTDSTADQEDGQQASRSEIRPTPVQRRCRVQSEPIKPPATGTPAVQQRQRGRLDSTQQNPTRLAYASSRVPAGDTTYKVIRGRRDLGDLHNKDFEGTSSSDYRSVLQVDGQVRDGSQPLAEVQDYVTVLPQEDEQKSVTEYTDLVETIQDIQKGSRDGRSLYNEGEQFVPTANTAQDSLPVEQTSIQDSSLSDTDWYLC